MPPHTEGFGSARAWIPVPEETWWEAGGSRLETEVHGPPAGPGACPSCQGKGRFVSFGKARPTAIACPRCG